MLGPFDLIIINNLLLPMERFIMIKTFNNSEEKEIFLLSNLRTFAYEI